MTSTIAHALVLAALVAVQGLRGPSTAAPPAAADREARLAALDPLVPLDYFELAEEIADSAVTADDRGLARTLFGLAGTLDRSLARSAALALAATSRDEAEARRLLAVAALVDERGGASLLEAVTPPSAAAAVGLSEAFSHFRRGQGSRALGSLKNPETDALLERFGPALTGGAARFREDCKAFRGGMRPELPPTERRNLLAIEEAALAAAGSSKDRTWSSILVETADRPLLEVDAERLAEAFGVDPTRPYWRSGRWQAAP
jgi:hypothetical protein